MKTKFALGVLVPCILAPRLALAWHAPGHDLATRTALVAGRAAPAPVAAASQPGALPAFFPAGVETIAHCSADPDNFTRPIGPPMLHAAEAPEHYFDLELVEGLAPPGGRYDFLEQLFARKLKPAQVGLLPYAVTEWTQRLTVAFAEHRRWPDDPAIRAKCLVYAGLLAHYAEDLCQPLHTTVHYDGRVAAGGGPSPRSGIHMKLDALLGKLAVNPEDAARDVRPVVFENVFAAALDEIRRGHALVDKVYELEKDIPAYEAALVADSKAAEFARERLRVTATFTASLFLTAWRDSARIQLPEWHHRPPVTPDRMSVK